MSEPIQVWRFADAPEAYQKLSTNGGDEDWIAIVPTSMADEYIPWLAYGSFGICSSISHILDDGRKMYIGCHG